MIVIQKRYLAKPWMTSNERSRNKRSFFDEHLPPLKPTGEHEIINQRFLQKQPQLRSSSIFPPNLSSRTAMTNNTLGSPNSSIPSNPTTRETIRHSLTRNTLPLLSPRSSLLLQIVNNTPPRRSTRYDHIHPKINTGLPRMENLPEIENDTYQLGPIRPLVWSVLKQELEQDKQIRAQAKRLQFNSGITYTKQLTTLTNLVRSKVKYHLSSMINSSGERYKIVVQLHVFQTKIGGLHIASRCLWNTSTDNSITIKLQGMDCNLLIIIFLCYTDLGAI